MSAQNGVHAETIFIEKDSIAEGIVKLISQRRIGKLVLCSSIDSRNSRNIAVPMSKMANYVLHCAPKFCHIWFVHNGGLIHTREAVKQQSKDVKRDKWRRMFGSKSSSTNSSTAELVGSSSPWAPNMHHGSSPPRVLAKESAEELVWEEEDFKDVKTHLDMLPQELLQASDQNLALQSKSDKPNLIVSEMQSVSAQVLGRNHENQCRELKLKRDNAPLVAQEFKKQPSQRPSSSHLPGFSSEFTRLDLEEATECFDPSLKIGEGSHGSVYKGFLRHTDVAIKILQPESLQGKWEFEQEVDVLSKLRHPNLVTFMGACPELQALIYEYLPNGSLEDRLICKNDTPPLPWQTRIRIATELCSVLNFLHSSQPCGITHGDLNPKNVLLDTNFVCKLSYSGIRCVIAEDKASHLDPEFLETGQLNPKCHVYSFGIILLRLLTGKPALGIVEEVQNAMDNDNLYSILDPSAGDWPFVRAKHLSYIALRCCDSKGSNRPDLASEVWRALKPLKAALGSLSTLRPVSEDHVPSYFICPIFQEIMHDPHFAADGFTYEADAIRGWYESGHDTSPMTNLKLPHWYLTPNRALRSAIQEWLQQLQSS